VFANALNSSVLTPDPLAPETIFTNAGSDDTAVQPGHSADGVTVTANGVDGRNPAFEVPTAENSRELVELFVPRGLVTVIVQTACA
jgi:hypothetical protein